MNLDEPGIHLFIGFNGTGIEAGLDGLLREVRPAGIILFKRNIESAAQVKQLVADAQSFARRETGRPLLVAVDQEGGTVQRLKSHFTDLPSAKDLASEGPEAISRWTRTAAADLTAIGIHVNFAPVLDIVPDGYHFMASRSLGSSPQRVAELGRIWIETLQENGISATAKHFPGLGRAALDPHQFAPVILNDDEEKLQRDLIPFKAAAAAGVHAMMSSHAVYPSVDPDRPATLSYEINQRLLREEIGFDGILFSDDLDMEAIGGNYTAERIARWGMECGTDFFLLCQKIDNIRGFHRALGGVIAKDDSLLRARRKSLGRIEKLFRFHFPDAG